MPLLIGREGSLAAVSSATNGTQELLLVTQRDADIQTPGSSNLHRIGVRARLLQVTRLAGGTTKILVEAVSRVSVQRYTSSRTSALLEARVTALPLRLSTAKSAPRDNANATLRHALTMFEEYASLQRRLPPEVVGLLQALDDEQRIAFGIAAHLQVRLEQRQRLLEAPTLAELSSQLVTVLGSELELLKLEKKLDEQVRGSLFQNQRDFYLQEQLRAIHKELGQEDGDEFEDLAKQVAARGLPPTVAARAHRELRKLKRSSPMSPDATVTRGWLDWALNLPWTVRSDDTIDLDHARSVLEADHYGLEEVKERILDYIAVLGRVGHLPGPILCLVGPPGVGKTSLGIACLVVSLLTLIWTLVRFKQDYEHELKAYGKHP